MKWNLADVINTVSFRPDRPLEKRDYVYASELGGLIKDRIWRMNALPYTNPPNERSRGKFLAGNIWQHTIEVILKVAGVFRESEVTMNNKPFDNCLEVHGRCDTIAWKFDVTIAATKLKEIAMLVPPDLMYKLEGVINALAGKDLEDKIIEIKSASEYVVEKVSVMKQPLVTHGLQAYHYHRHSGIPASVLYISKNDFFTSEAEVSADVYEQLYREDLEKITYYFTRGEEAPPENPLWFNNLTGKFEKTQLLEYSPYLKYHGWNSPFDFRQSVEPTVKKWNEAIKRFVNVENGALTEKGNAIKMTPGAEEARKEIIAAGYDFDAIIEVKKRFMNEPETETDE